MWCVPQLCVNELLEVPYKTGALYSFTNSSCDHQQQLLKSTRVRQLTLNYGNSHSSHTHARAEAVAVFDVLIP